MWEGCPKVVTGRYKSEGLTRVLQECYKSVARALQGRYKGVTRTLQGCVYAVRGMYTLQSSKRESQLASKLPVCYKGVTRVLERCYKSVTRVSQECNKGVTRLIERMVHVCWQVCYGGWESCHDWFTIVLQEYCKDVTRTLQECYTYMYLPCQDFTNSICSRRWNHICSDHGCRG
jgi:hypothetical protein